MAVSNCPKCESTSFELKAGEAKGSKHKLMYIQCASCGGVVGVTDYYNIPFLLGKIAKHLGLTLFK
jgi:predicted nucleic-acid-binding Zn-ribbon protein